MKFVFSTQPLLSGLALLLLAAPSRVLAAPRLVQADDENVIINADRPEATLPPPAQPHAPQKKAPAKPAPAAKAAPVAKPAAREYSQPYRAPDDGDSPAAGALPQNAAPSFSASPPAPPAAPTTSSFGSVAGVALIDGTDAKNLAILRAAFEARLNGKMVLWDGRNRWTATRAQLGLSIPYETLLAEASRVRRDVPLRFSLDETKLRATLTRLAEKIERGGALKNVASTEKIQVALPASMQRIERALESNPPQDYAELVVTRAALAAPKRATPPSGISAFPYILAQYSTPYNAAIRGRTNNLRMAARLVNGYVVKPGATFSTNRAIGPRNAAAGWREAKMFINGQIVDGVGSGICQCSTTIYNAALLANLPILERHPHTFRVTYAPASRDAAIYWGQKDMKFRNDTGGPIYVETKLRGGRFHVRLLSTQPSTASVEVQSRVLARGNGTRSEAYRVVKTFGGTQRVRLSRDFYRPHP